MIGNREVAKVVHEIERAVVERDEAAKTEKSGKPTRVVFAPRWEETSPEYQNLRAEAVHGYRMDGTVDPSALDENLYRATVDALK